MAAICRDGLYSQVYYRKRRRHEKGGGLVEKGEGILGIQSGGAKGEEGEESNLTLAVMMKKLRKKKKKTASETKPVPFEGLEQKDLIFDDQIGGQNGKREEIKGIDEEFQE